MNKLTLKISPAILLILAISALVVSGGTIAFAANADVENWSATPEIMSQVNLKGSQFDAHIVFNLSRSVGFDQVKALIRDGSLFAKFSSWVKDVSYSAPRADGSYDFDLTIGKMGLDFTHNFLCRDEQTQNPDMWTQTCTQKPATSDVVLTEGLQTTQCTKTLDGATEGIQCEFALTGLMHKTTGLFSFSGSHVAYTYFVEFTSYVAQLSLMAGNVAHSPTEAARAFKSPDLERMMEVLSAKQSVANDLGPSEDLPVTASSPQAYTPSSERMVSR